MPGEHRLDPEVEHLLREALNRVNYAITALRMLIWTAGGKRVNILEAAVAAKLMKDLDRVAVELDELLSGEALVKHSDEELVEYLRHAEEVCREDMMDDERRVFEGVRRELERRIRSSEKRGRGLS